LGYIFTLFKKNKSLLFQDIDGDSIIGVIFNNQAEYYIYAGYNKVSFVELGATVSKEIELS